MQDYYDCWTDCSLVHKGCVSHSPEHLECGIREIRKHNERYCFGIHPKDITSYRMNMRLWCIFLYDQYYAGRRKGLLGVMLEYNPGMLTNALKLLVCIKYNKDNEVFATNKFETDMFLKLLVYVTGYTVKELMSYIKNNYEDGYGDDFIDEFFIQKKISTLGRNIDQFIVKKEDL